MVELTIYDYIIWSHWNLGWGFACSHFILKHNMKKIKKGLRNFASNARLVGYELPKAVARKAFTNANFRDVFPSMKRRKR